MPERASTATARPSGDGAEGMGGGRGRVRGVSRSALAAATLALAAHAAHAQDAGELATGKALFLGGAQPPCAVCHTLQDAGAVGAVGPSLDDLKPDAARVATAVKTGLGAMPSFRATLTDAQIQALARYVAKATGGAP